MTDYTKINNNNNEDDTPSWDYGKVAMILLAINALALFLTNISVLACYQLPSLKENCEITDTENCIQNENSEYSVIWIIPLVLAILHLSWIINRKIIPFVSPKWWRQLHFRATPIGSGKYNENEKQIMTRRWRATTIGWFMFAISLLVTITTLWMSNEVVNKRCNDDALAKLKDTDNYNGFYGFLGSLAYKMTNNYGYKYNNFMSFANPKYYIYCSTIAAFIFMGLATTPEMKRQAAAAMEGKQSTRNGRASANGRIDNYKKPVPSSVLGVQVPSPVLGVPVVPSPAATLIQSRARGQKARAASAKARAAATLIQSRARGQKSRAAPAKARAAATLIQSRARGQKAREIRV